MSMTFAAVISDADDPCSVNTAHAPEWSLTMSPQRTTRPLYFWYWGSSSEFFRWQRSINDAKWTFQPLFLASSITSFLFLSFVSCRAGVFFSFSLLFYYCCLCIWNLHCLKHRNEFVNKTVMIQRIHPFFSNMILMMFVSSSFEPWSRVFASIERILSCVSQYCGGFHHCSLSVFWKALLPASELLTFYERLSLWV